MQYDSKFEIAFKALAGCRPMRWQRRLYELFVAGNFCDVIDLPTGLGKTMVMAVWLIALENNGRLPRRLIYVVDRRTVVDQATDLAEKLQENFGKDRLAISTLRGQLADNREWSRDPARPAIIIGTVDLIGSALLFSGYRSSYKRRPVEAGLLGQDSVLVLDEAHLSQPFEKLIERIGLGGRFQKDRDGKPHGTPMRVIRMSATSGSADSNSFTLQFDDRGNLTGEDAKDPITTERFGAKKRLTIVTLGEKDDLNKRTADAAIELAKSADLMGKRIVVFVRSPDDARDIAENIRDNLKPNKTKSNPDPKGPYASSVDVLTGTMRGLERDELVEKPVFKERWLNGNLTADDPANQEPVFLVSTSAGEVGFDLNADHLVGDAAPLDSWIQRLGRVNRRGYGDATVILVKQKEPSNKTEFDKTRIATLNLLTDSMDVSPKALNAFKQSLTPKQIDDASSSKPMIVELTDILLDAWSMTSIDERMPGRPEVGPWLRGIAEWEPPQTEIAWRAELDLDGFADLDLADIKEWFDTHRILTHETLKVKTGDAATWFKDRWDNIHELERGQLTQLPVIIDRAGMEKLHLGEVIDRLSRKAADADGFLCGAEIVVPASFGGIRRGVGLLDPTEPKRDKEEETKSLEEHKTILKGRQDSIDVADVRGRYREKVKKPEDGEAIATPLDFKAVKPPRPARYALELLADDDATLRLVSYVPRRERLDWGMKRQYLHDHDGKRGHVECVRDHANAIIRRLGLQSNDQVRQALELAADWHDNGKDRERWQGCAGRKPPEPALGKSGGEMKRDSRGYRHEFGSLREFTDSMKNKVNNEVFDLAMHLIATHHGRGRPHFPKGAFDPDCEARSDEIHTESIRRFARLQRKYGWWYLAWLENLLRCADALASADAESEDDPDGDAA